MNHRLTRRSFLRGSLALGGAAVAIGGVEAARQAWDLVEQRRTWAEAALPNDEFLARHAAGLARLRLGASFAPEEWGFHTGSDGEARQALAFAIQDLNLRRLRFGVRWNRAADANGEIDLHAYAPYIDYCLAHGAEVCLNVGPVRVFRSPEEHVPAEVLGAIRVPAGEATLQPDDELSQRALAYLDDLLHALRAEYGGRLAAIQVENEPFYPLGRHRWRFSSAYLQAVVQRIDAAFSRADILVTSAGRLNLWQIRDLFAGLLAADEGLRGRLVSGFDFHYQTPRRDSIPVIRHFDQISYARPFAPATSANIRAARDIGYRIEVTEGQAEPYGRFTSPGSSATDFRYLLLRCLDNVFDPAAPALLRVWGIEGLVKKLVWGQATAQHHQIAELIRAINAQPGSGAGV